MCKVDIKIKNGKVVASTRISKGFDENGKRLRARFHLELDEVDYPTKESQLQAFDDYLVSIGESAIGEVKESEDTIQAKEDDKSNKKIDMERIEVNQANEVSTRHIKKIPLSQIRLNEFNPYTIDDEFIKRLAYAIKEDGLNNPIHVTLKDNDYIVNKGNKRYLAFELLNKKIW